jgi:hypothetical protein
MVIKERDAGQTKVTESAAEARQGSYGKLVTPFSVSSMKAKRSWKNFRGPTLSTQDCCAVSVRRREQPERCQQCLGVPRRSFRNQSCNGIKLVRHGEAEASHLLVGQNPQRPSVGARNF